MTDFRSKAEHYLILVEGEREMREAIALHLEGLAQDGLPLPEASGPGVYLAA